MFSFSSASLRCSRRKHHLLTAKHYSPSMLQLSLCVSFVLANLPPASCCQLPRGQPSLVISLSSETVGSNNKTYCWRRNERDESQLPPSVLPLSYSHTHPRAHTRPRTFTHIWFGLIRFTLVMFMFCFATDCWLSCITETEGIKRFTCKKSSNYTNKVLKGGKTTWI